MEIHNSCNFFITHAVELQDRMKVSYHFNIRLGMLYQGLFIGPGSSDTQYGSTGESVSSADGTSL